jgi:4-hydroxy-tetrahydrodipicolinate reductase
MAIVYKIDVLKALKEAGYNTSRLRKDKIMGEATIQKIRENAFFTFGRQGHAKREKNEIGVHAIRMGNIVGEHEVIVGTDTQTITLKHEAHSRSLFAEGAIAAADFIKDKSAGLYDMYSMIGAE